MSHGSAAVLWKLLRPLDGPVHVSVPTTSGHRKRRGIHLHRCPSLSPSLITRRDNIPVTTVSRTIHDLDGYLSPHLVRRAIRQAERHGLPPPEVNVKLGRWEVDFLWRAQRLVVETDSFAYHRGSVAFEDDHARDLDLRAAGFTVLRFTGRQLEEEPGRVVADVARALSQEDWY